MLKTNCAEIVRRKSKLFASRNCRWWEFTLVEFYMQEGLGERWRGETCLHERCAKPDSNDEWERRVSWLTSVNQTKNLMDSMENQWSPGK